MNDEQEYRLVRGVVHGLFLFLLFASLCLIGLGITIARAEECEIGDFGCRHHEYHNWYQTGENGGPILRPDQPGSCCDGDCRPTKVKFVGDRVFAYIDRQWVLIPQTKIKTISKPDSLAHICATSQIYCLILPDIEN